MESAYRTNAELEAMRQNVMVSDENMPSAVSGFLPSAYATYNRGRSERDIGGASDDNITENREVQIRQPLFRGGKNISRVNQAKHLVGAARADLREAEQRVLLDSCVTYMDVFRDVKILELANSKIDVMQKHLDVAKERFSLGEVTKTDVAQAEASHANAISEKITAEGSLEASKAALKRVSGVEFAEMEPALPVSVQITLEEMIEIAMEENPAIESVKYNKDAAQNNLSSEKSDLLPTVDMVASKSRQKGALFSNSQIDDTSLTVNVTVPLYQGGSEYSDVRRAKRNLSKFNYSLDEQRNKIREEVIRAWNNLEVAKAVIKSDESAVKASEIALDGTRQEVNAGTRTMLDLLDAEQDLYRSKASLIRAKRDEVVSSYTLLAQVGRLSAEELGLNVEIYNPEDNYNKRKYQIIGF